MCVHQDTAVRRPSGASTCCGGSWASSSVVRADRVMWEAAKSKCSRSSPQWIDVCVSAVLPSRAGLAMSLSAENKKAELLALVHGLHVTREPSLSAFSLAPLDH